MRTLGNIIWFIFFGGLITGLLWCIAGLIAFISIVGIPWGRACFVIAEFTFWPFGRRAVNRSTITGTDDLGTGTLGVVGNVIWVLIFGIWIAIAHFLAAIACFVTIIGIPFGIQHWKMISISLLPIGQTIRRID